MWLWPPPLPPTYLLTYDDMTASLMPLFVASLLIVFAALAGLLLRMGRRTRRVMRTVTCPDQRRPALVLVKRTAERDTVADCSLWHDRPLDCDGRCLARRTGTDG